MGENNPGDMLKNIERIQSLSRLMSNNTKQPDGEKIINAIAAAKSMGILGGNTQRPGEITAFENSGSLDTVENEGAVKV